MVDGVVERVWAGLAALLALVVVTVEYQGAESAPAGAACEWGVGVDAAGLEVGAPYGVADASHGWRLT